MAESIKEAPYEILLRFNCEVGEAAGTLRGMSCEQRRYLVDENGIITGRIDRGREDMPQPFPVEKLVDFLGQKFVDFEAGQRAIVAGFEADKKKLKEDHDENVKGLVERQTAYVADLTAAAVAEMKTRDGAIAELKATAQLQAMAEMKTASEREAVIADLKAKHEAVLGELKAATELKANPAEAEANLAQPATEKQG